MYVGQARSQREAPQSWRWINWWKCSLCTHSGSSPHFIKTFRLCYSPASQLTLASMNRKVICYQLELGRSFASILTRCSSRHRAKWMTTGTFGQNVCKVFSKLSLVTDNLLPYLSVVCLCSDSQYYYCWAGSHVDVQTNRISKITHMTAMPAVGKFLLR